MMKFLALAVFLPVASYAAPAATIISDFTKLGIQAEVVKHLPAKMQELENVEDRYVLEVKLGRLTQAQYQSMMALYGNKSRVAFDPSKAYELLDFLPPAMQATANQAFLNQSYDTQKFADAEAPDEGSEMVFHWLRKNGVSSLTNCWNTTLEVLRLQYESESSVPVYRLYWPGRWETNEFFSSNEFSRKIPASGIAPFDALVVKQKVFSTEEYMIQHTAVVLSDSLLFERTDSSDNDAYRISYRRDVEAKYRRLFEDKERKIEFRRFSTASKFPAPSFGLATILSPKGMKLAKKLAPEIPYDRLTHGCETALGGGCDENVTEVHEAKVIINPSSGRGIFQAKKVVLDRFVDITK